MFIVFVAVTVLTAAINAWAAAADFARAEAVVANATQVNLKPEWVVPLGVPKAAAAVGLLVGLAWYRPLVVAAAAGLVIFFSIAVAIHIKEKVYFNIAFPGTFLACAAATLVLALTV